MRRNGLILTRRVPIVSQLCPVAIATRTSGSDVKSFDEIPEPKRLPLIGTFLDYTPVHGFKIPYVFDLWAKRHNELGDIYKEKIPGDSQYQVFCRSPNDTETMFRSESRTPIRNPVEAITFLKEKAGLPDSMFNLSGEEWYKHSRVINGPLLMNKMVWKYINEQQEVSRDFVEWISGNIDERGEIDNFASMLTRWAFEMSGTFLLNTRFGMLRDSLDPDVFDIFQGPAQLLQFAADDLSGIKWWKYMSTKKSREAVRSVSRSWEVMGAIMEKRLGSEELEGTTLGEILKDQELSEIEKMNLVFDLLGASLETTSQAAAFLLYCLTLNQEIQEKVRAEILELPEELTGRMVDGMKYLGAFMKESNRLYPVAHVFARKYAKDIVLSGYRIPAGINISNTANSTLNRNPEYFPQPNEFIPERWLRDADAAGRFNLTGPWGIGSRACPGRRFATQELRLLLIEILKKYRVEYHHEPIVSIFRLSGAPSKEPNVRFIALTE